MSKTSEQELIDKYVKSPARAFEQLEFCKYEDRHGHSLEMNVAYQTIKKILSGQI